MNPNPLIGVIYHWIGGLASASNFIPFRPIKRWSWEIYWIIQGFAAWIVAPLVLASIFVPHLSQLLHTAPADAIHKAIFWGLLWGAGGITFGLAIRYLGIALGYAIALGFCTVFGTIVPPLYSGQLGVIAHQRGGRMILLGVFVCMIAIAVNGFAGYYKEKDITEEDKAATGERDYSFGKGLAIAVFAGVMSSCFAFGLDSGKPLADMAQTSLLSEGHLALWKNLPVLIPVLWGGFVTNFIWSLILIIKNGTGRQFFGAPGSNPMGTSATTGDTMMDVDLRNPEDALRIRPGVLTKNYLLASLAGVIWYFQFFFYSMGETEMGKYGFSSWTLHMASIIIFATLWGIALHEWRDTSRKARLLNAFGLLLLIGSTVVVGYGNMLSSR